MNLIDSTLACEYDNSKFVKVVTVAHVDDEKRVGNSLVQIWKVFVQTLSTRFQDLVKNLKLRYGDYFAADDFLWLQSSILVEILKLGSVKIFKFELCRNLIEIG